MMELLEMCGFDANEARAESARIERAFSRMGITADDIERGKQRLAKYYDMELQGVRKMFRLALLETVDAALAREEGKSKVLFGLMAPGFEAIGSALVSQSKEVCAIHQSWAFFLIFGCIFDKVTPVLEAAERQWLKTGMVFHCSNVKSLVGMLELEIMPKPDLLVTSGFLCETAPKSVDLLHELYGIPIGTCYDTCQDREFEEYTAATERIVRFEGKSLRRLVDKIQEVVSFELTDDVMSQTLDVKDELGAAVGRVRDIIKTSDPLPVSATHETLLTAMNALTLNRERLQQAIEAVNTLAEELEARVEKGLGVMEKGAPRIAALLPTHHADSRMEYLLGKQGITVVATNLCYPPPEIAIPQDPYERMSLTNLQGPPSHCTKKRLSALKETCQQLEVDGILDRYHTGCRAVVGDAMLIWNAIVNELDMPALLLEWENFDPRVYNHEQYLRSFETFKAMLKVSRERRPLRRPGGPISPGRAARPDWF